MRHGFRVALAEAARRNNRLIFLTGDLGFQVFDDFRKEFGSRYVNVGVAEAELMCAAAGLALEGWRPVVYSIASFATARAYEQIRVSIAYAGLPVVIVGAGGGYLYGACGATHHAGDDFGLMCMLPGMTVVAPGGPTDVTQLLPSLLELPGPSYIRIGKFGEPDYRALAPVVLGKARLMAEGERVAVLCAGEMAPVVDGALDTLHAEGVHPLVYQFHTIKPLDGESLKLVALKAHSAVLVEEAASGCGWSASVLAWAAEHARSLQIVRLGPPAPFLLGNPERDTVRSRHGFDRTAIEHACRRLWHRA